MRKTQARGLEPAHIWQRNGASARAVYPANTLCNGAEFARASAPFLDGLFPDQQVAVLATGAKAHVATLPQQSASFGRHEHTRALNRSPRAELGPPRSLPTQREATHSNSVPKRTRGALSLHTRAVASHARE